MPKATTSDGVELHYEIRGNPDAPNKVIFIMGLSGSHRGWDMQSRYFANLPDYQIIVYDNRGAGFSHSPTTPYSVETMAADAIFLADEVRFEKFHVVGVSMGGMIAQHVALSVPERIISVTLIVTRVAGGFFNNLPTMRGIFQFYKMQANLDNPEALINAGADLLFPYAFLEKIAEDGSGKTNRQVLHDMVIQRNKEVPLQNADGKKHQLAAVKAHGISNAQMDQLKKANFPILAIVGDQDILIRPSHSYYLPSQIGADLIIIEEAGHGLIQQCPQLVNYYIKEHCDRSAKGVPRNAQPKTTKVHYTYKHDTAATSSKTEEVQKQAEAVEGMEKVAAEI